MTAQWTRELTMELLQHLQGEPVLWDNRHPDYKDSDESFRAWRRIQAEMSRHMAVSELSARKEELFSKYHRLEIRMKTRSAERRGVRSEYEPEPEEPRPFVPAWYAFPAIASFLNHPSRRNRFLEMSGNTGASDSQEQSSEKKPTFQEQFKLFSKFGDRDSDGKHIKLLQSDKWMRQAKVIDGKKITATDTGICFKKLKHPKLSESEYNTFLEDLAKSKGFDVSELKTKMTNCGPPGFSSSVKDAKPTGAVERLTDPSKYTGSHKERFDETGKGKGLAGRREDVDASGYVAGYTNKNTYDKEHPTN